MEIVSTVITESLCEPAEVLMILGDNQYLQDIPNMSSKWHDIDMCAIEVINNRVRSLAIPSNIFVSTISKYLGDNLIDAIRSLDIKEVEGSLPSEVNKKFFAINETPWECLSRLMSYIPRDYYWYCGFDKIHIFTKPTEFIEYKQGGIEVTVTPYRNRNKDLIQTDNNYNLMYGGLVNVPVSTLQKKKWPSIDIVKNRVSNMARRDNVYESELTIKNMEGLLPLGTGILYNGVEYMVSSRISMASRDGQTVTSTMKIIKV